MRQEHSAEDACVRSFRASCPAILIASLATGCVSKQPADVARFEFSQAQMGLEFRMTVYASDATTASNAVAAAYQRIGELNGILSDYDPDSELSRVSQMSGSGRWTPVSPELWRVLEAAQRMARLSDGAFDITIGPSVNLWRRARRQLELPSPDLLSVMRDRVGYTNLVLDPTNQAALLRRPDMRLDAGGIAKGYALDEALAVLRRNGTPRAMIHAGGDIVCGDPPPGRTGWRIELPGLEVTNAPVLMLGRQALATSGDLFQFVEIDGVRYSHIVDPRTGIGLTNRSLVHVVAPEGMTADALATAISVLGPDAGMALLHKFPGAEGQIVTGLGTARTMRRSSGFRPR